MSVIPAQAGTQGFRTLGTGFPPTREWRRNGPGFAIPRTCLWGMKTPRTGPGRYPRQKTPPSN